MEKMARVIFAVALSSLLCFTFAGCGCECGGGGGGDDDDTDDDTEHETAPFWTPVDLDGDGEPDFGLQVFFDDGGQLACKVEIRSASDGGLIFDSDVYPNNAVGLAELNDYDGDGGFEVATAGFYIDPDTSDLMCWARVWDTPSFELIFDSEKKCSYFIPSIWLDATGDGVLDVVMPESDSGHEYVRVYDGTDDFDLAWEFGGEVGHQYALFYGAVKPPFGYYGTANFNKADYKGVVVLDIDTTVDPETVTLHAVDGATGELTASSDPLPVGTGYFEMEAIGDFDHDGVDEIGIAVSYEDPVTSDRQMDFYIFEPDDFSTAFHLGPVSDAASRDVDICDVDGDGYPEIALFIADYSVPATPASFGLYGWRDGDYEQLASIEPTLDDGFLGSDVVGVLGEHGYETSASFGGDFKQAYAVWETAKGASGMQVKYYLVSAQSGDLLFESDVTSLSNPGSWGFAWYWAGDFTGDGVVELLENISWDSGGGTYKGSVRVIDVAGDVALFDDSYDGYDDVWCNSRVDWNIDGVADLECEANGWYGGVVPRVNVWDGTNGFEGLFSYAGALGEMVYLLLAPQMVEVDQEQE